MHHAGTDDDAVGHDAGGDVFDQRHGLLGGDGGVRGTEDLGRIPLGLNRIHRDDIFCADGAGALQGVHPDTTGPEDDDGVAGFGARRYRCRAPAGADTARHQ